MKQQSKITLAAIVSGLTSGTAATFVAMYFMATPPTEEPVKVEFNTEPAPSVHPADVSSAIIAESNRDQLQSTKSQLEKLKQRVDYLASMGNSVDTVDGGVEFSDELSLELEEPFSPEEDRANVLAWWEETKATFHQEPIDPSWATETSEMFTVDIDELAVKSNFTAIETECRSTRCSATIEWPTYNDAMQEFTELLHHSYQANCARHTILPEPGESDLDTPYQATVIFDCAEWRDGVI